MRTRLFLLLVLSSFLLTSTTKIPLLKIECFEVVETFPLFPKFNKDNNTWYNTGYDTSIGRVYIYKNWKLFRCYFEFAGILDKNGDIKTPKKQYYYLLHKERDEFAYCFDKKRKLFNLKVNADSALKQDWIVNANSDDMFNTDKYDIKFVSKKIDKGILKINYLINLKIDTSAKATCNLSYTDKFVSQFKLTNKLDTIKGMQLIKIITVYQKCYYKDKKTNMGEFEIFQELKKIKTPNDPEIISLFKLHD